MQVKKHILILLAFIGLNYSAGAQVAENIKPASKIYSKMMLGSVSEVSLPALNPDEVAQLDFSDAKNGHLPKFSRSVYTDLSLHNSGNWNALPDGGRVWRVILKAHGAKGLIPFFDRFHLPEGASLHVYSPDYRQTAGAFTADNNNASGYFCAGLIAGNCCVVEYFEPAAARDKGILHINEVGYAYRWVDGTEKSQRDFGDAASCQVNVNCSEGAGYQNQAKSVVRILVQSGTGQGWCSGALINNARIDCTPYLLSAQHCSEGTSANQYSQWVFYFNYEAPGCANPASQGMLGNKTVIGCTKKADSNDGGGSTGSDFVLLQLNSSPNTSWTPYYSGWNNNNTASSSGVSIHHPSGDIKKISTYTQTITSSTWGGAVPNTHWSVKWIQTPNGHGVTEPGSSGAPLFNVNGEIIGTLTGGDSYCNAPNQPDQYGKFSHQWQSNGAAANRQLKAWLDPDNIGLNTLSGTFAPCGALVQNDAGVQSVENPVGAICANATIPSLTLRNYGSNALANVIINYSIDGNPYQYTWNGNLSSQNTTVVILPQVSLTPGPHTFTAETTQPNGSNDNNPANDTKVSLFQSADPSGLLNLYLKTDNYGSETTWEIIDGNATIRYSGGPYSDAANGQTFNYPICLAPGCYSLVLYDSYGDGMDGNISGEMKLSGNNGTVTFAELTAPGFGFQKTFNFCIQATGLTMENPEAFTLWPNPSSGNLTVRNAQSGITDYCIQNIAGQTMLSFRNETAHFTLDMSHFPKGMYIVRAQHGTSVTSRKLVIQ